MKLLLLICILAISATLLTAYPANYPGYYSALSMEEPYPNHMSLKQAIAKLKQALIDYNDLEENTKRGLDLGLGRGFSGSQAAKHLMGLAAANFAGGPGRKRRSIIAE